MLRKLLNTLLNNGLRLVIAILGARLVAWATGDPKLPLLSVKQLILTVVLYVIFVFLGLILESQKAISFNWPWHRLWYFRAMSKAGKLGTERLLHDPNDSDDAVFIEVLEYGRRKNLVALLQQRLERKEKPRRFLIVGDAGSGKSTALEQLRIQMLLKGTKHFGFGKAIPILIKLGNYGESKLLDFVRKVWIEDSRKLEGKDSRRAEILSRKNWFRKDEWCCYWTRSTKLRAQTQ